MTFIKLTNDNFTKTKIINNNKRYYKESDISTYEYDNAINSKSLLPIDFNTENKQYNNFLDSSENININELNKLKSTNSINNNDIKLYNLKNAYKIDRLTSKFLYDDDFLYKKNFIKKNIYETYYRNSSFDYIKYLNYGFCNYNTINLYSNNKNLTHSNCIVYSNELDSKNINTYDIYNKDNLNFSFRVIFRNLDNLKTVNTLLHIPDLIDIYFIKSNTNDNIRLGINLGIKTKINKNDYSVNLTNDSRQVKSSESQYLSSNLFLEQNKWFYISLSLNKNGDDCLINLYKDSLLFDSFKLSTGNEINNKYDSYICIGNKPNYFNNIKNDYVNYKNSFDLIFSNLYSDNLFGSLFRKDILCKNIINNDQTIQEISNNNDIIKFNNSERYTCSFNGEIADIKIYNDAINPLKIKENYEKYISDIETEKSLGLVFYVPVFFIPSIKKENCLFNFSDVKYNIKHSGYYNTFISNSCGLFKLNTENYLIEFCNITKPNVIIGGHEVENIYDNNLENNVGVLFNEDIDNEYIKKGYTLQQIFLKNFDISVDNDQNCLTYNNLLILPNDDGIPKVNWNTINYVFNSNRLELEEDYLKYYRNKNEINLYNIACNDIINNDNLYYINKTKNIENYTSTIEISNTEDQNINDYDLGYENKREFSDILFHDYRLSINNLKNDIDNFISFNENYNIKEKDALRVLYNKINYHYDISESNPILRNIHSVTKMGEIIERREHSDNLFINYRKAPLPYCDILKEYDNQFMTIFSISNKLYNKKIKKSTFELSDNNLVTTNGKVKISLKDNNGVLFRNDCLTKVANWNYVGHVFYNEGIVQINNPISVYFGFKDFEMKFDYETSMFVHQIDIPVDRNLFNLSNNKSYDETLRHDDSRLNSQESFVYITDIHLHDENYNIISKAKVARPIPKKQSDRFLIKLKMDY